MAKIKSTIDVEKGSLEIKVEGHGDIVISTNDISSQEVLNYAPLHGLKQKIVDAAALGQGYSMREKYDSMLEVYHRLIAPDGTWNKAGEGTTVSGLLYRALCRLYPAKDPEILKAYHDKLSKKEQFALRSNPKIAPIIEEIKLEKVSTNGVDSDSLLEELEDI